MNALTDVMLSWASLVAKLLEDRATDESVRQDVSKRRGTARALALSPARRHEIAVQAAQARWSRKKMLDQA